MNIIRGYTSSVATVYGVAGFQGHERVSRKASWKRPQQPSQHGSARRAWRRLSQKLGAILGTLLGQASADASDGYLDDTETSKAASSIKSPRTPGSPFAPDALAA